MKKSTLILIAASLISTLAFADDQAPATATPDAAAPVAAAPAAAVSVPAIEVVYNCGDCQPGETIKGTIVGAYQDAAKAANATVDPANKATLIVTKFHQRSGAARFMLGVLSVPDRIEGTLVYAGKSYAVGDTAHTGFNGIDDVAKNVGKTSLSDLVTPAPAVAASAN